MDYALVILVTLIALAVTFSPLLRRRRIWFVGDVESDYADTLRKREEALRALKDLEEDLLSRKLSREDYERLRPRYLDLAKELTVKLDDAAQRRALARKRIEEQLAEGIPERK
jgi:hypothetical protein